MTTARLRPGAVRLSFVLLCVLLTAALYAACIAVVVRGNVQALYPILPWLAAAAIGGCALLALLAVGERSRSRLRDRRRRLAAERLAALARAMASLDDAKRERAVRRLVKHLDLTRNALALIADTGAHEQLVAAGVADRVGLELGESHGKWHRITAAGVLSLLGSGGSIGPLTYTLGDRDPDVAYAAAQALAQYAEPAAYEALLDALAAEAIPPARVAGLLETFRCPDARELIEPRADADETRIRYWAAYLLGRLGDPRSQPVIERLTHDTSEDVRASAADALASFPDETTLRRLLADQSWIVRSHAAKTTGATRRLSLAPRLAELLEDGAWWVRQNAAVALAGLGEAAVPALVSQLHSRDRFARNKAGEVLVQIGYAAEQVDLLRDGNRAGETARRLLVDLGRAEALSTIATAARTTSDPILRARLIGVLVEIGTEQAAAALRAIGAKQADGVRQKIAAEQTDGVRQAIGAKQADGVLEAVGGSHELRG